MPLFRTKHAQLKDLEGIGYLFSNKMDEVQGVFYLQSEDSTAFDALEGQEAVLFKGFLYTYNRAGAVRGKQVELEVDIQDVTKVAMGDRVSLVAT
jgi:hypothetical protein